jgi:hypothetical protein
MAAMMGASSGQHRILLVRGISETSVWAGPRPDGGQESFR